MPGAKLDMPKAYPKGEYQGWYESTILNIAYALARRAYTMEGMHKSKNAIVAFVTFSMV
jgi:hypothetical protein